MSRVPPYTNSAFNRYDFLERDEAGEWYYNDEYLFSADSSIDVDRQRELLWEENRKNFQQGAYGDPQLLQTCLVFWQNMEQAHYPWAHENVERIRDEIARQQDLMLAQQQSQQRMTVAQQNPEQTNFNGGSYENYLASQIINQAGGQSNGGQNF